MGEGAQIALEQISSVNDNMSKSHYHEYFELYFLDSGHRYNMIDNTIYETQAGDFLIFSPWTMHHSYSDKDVPFSRVVIYFQPSVVTSPVLLDALLNTNRLYRPTVHQLPKMRRLIYQMMEEQNHKGILHEEYLRSTLMLILLEILRMGQVREIPESENRINEVISYIHTNYAQEIRLDELAARFHITESHLCRDFRKYTNRTIVQYIHSTRVLNAQRHFMETDDNVSEVMSLTGFTNLTHFNRVFRDVTGMSPSAFRKKCREEHSAHV